MDELESHRVSALAAIKAFIVALELEELSGWAEKFRSVSDALESGDDRMAVSLYRAIPVGGMGGLSDILPMNQSAFDIAWGNAGRAIERIRQYHRSRD
jgi:hypothetical protein